MKQLRAIRILLAALFFAASAACLLIGPHVHPMADAAGRVQIAFTGVSISAGVLLSWLVITLIVGRVYCASVCPVGVFSDAFLWIRRKCSRFDRPFSYRRRSRIAPIILWVYVLCIILGIVAIPFTIGPWNIARNMASIARPEAVSTTWMQLGVGLSAGILAGILSAILIAGTSLWRGREFCSRYCPVGSALGYVSGAALLHLEIDPDKCNSCGLCEDRCRVQGIKVAERHIDNSRCVRCFDCMADCPEEAIRLQINPNIPATPLLRRKRSIKG